MRSLILIFTVFVLTSAGPIKERGVQLMLIKSEKDASLKLNEAIFKFDFRGFDDANDKRVIHYSIDGYEGKQKLTDNSYLEFKTRPGKHIFQFYYSEEYYEFQSDSLLIRPGYKDEYAVNLRSSIRPTLTKKPVIYLYPESEIDVEVKLDIKGTETFIYPAYKDGWNFKAQPDGTLTFGENKYNYLFWEAEQFIPLSERELQNGFVVKGENAITFLEEKLTLAGLTTKEQADFITFWGPELSRNETNFVRFEFNDACNRFAKLNITPTPETIYRIYIMWSPVNSNYQVTEQKIEPIVRKGFTVLEWGGQELKPQLNVTQNY